MSNFKNLKVMRYSTIIAIAAALLPLQSQATDLIPEQCTIGDRPFVHPLEFVSFSFDGGVRLGESAKAYVTCGDETVIEATSFEVSNYVGEKRTQGWVNVLFDKTNLPLGKDYTLVVEPQSIVSETDPDLTTGLIEVPFAVPADLGDIWDPDIKPGQIVTSLRSIWVYWRFETDPVGEPEWILYRDGEEEGRYPAHVGWDWDLGQAYVDFGEEKKFDKDVEYSLVLPAGSVSSCYRTDIVNREVRIDFTGGYVPQPDPITYDGCRIEVDSENCLGIVAFHFNRMVWTLDGAKMLLLDVETEECLVQEDLHVNTMINCSEIYADFGGYQLEPMKGYTFVIPEGMLVAIDGDPVFNSRQSYGFNAPSGVASVTDDAEDVSPLYDLFGNRIHNPQSGSVYIRNGHKIIW